MRARLDRISPAWPSWISTAPGRIAAAALVVASLVVPLPVAASTRPGDRVGGIALSDAPQLLAAAPDIRAPAGILVTSDGQELWSREADEQRAMASTTKIMTAIVVLESVDDLDALVTVPPEAARIGEAEAGFGAGQKVSVRTLLEGMLVQSGNDAALALAVHVAGSEKAFVERMNAKAQELDATRTAFSNVHGLDAPGHHTTAHDLATIARYALTLPAFREIVRMRSITVPVRGGSVRYENSNRLIGSYQGATGVKTGWTNKAGYCLVASAARDGVELVCVILGTRSEEERFREARTLLEWGFAHYRMRRVASQGTTLAAVPVEDYLDVTVPAVVAETTSVPVLDTRGALDAAVSVSQAVKAPVARGQRLGTLTIVQGDTLIVQVPVVAASDVPTPALYERVRVWCVRAWRRVFGGDAMARLTVRTPALP